MNRPSRYLAVALALATLPLAGNAQTPAPSPPPPARPAASRGSARGPAADPLAAERRTQAAAIIVALADEARGFHDGALSARVQAQAADALWPTDKERARTLFRRAWDAAEVVDRENLRSAAAGVRRPDVRANRPNLRGEVLRLAAKRDRALGEELLSKLAAGREQENSELANATPAPATRPADAPAGAAPPRTTERPQPELPPELARRLQLAIEFVNDGNLESALQFAEPALVKPYQMVIEFLTLLREKDPTAADQRYGALLARTAADPEADANSALLLSSYVLTPHMYMVISRNGGLNTSRWRRETVPPADLPAPLRQALARTAAQILLRPLPAPDQDQTSAGRGGTYFTIARLLPFIEGTIPALSADLRARLAALTPDVSAEQRSEMERDLTSGLTSEPQRGDRVQNALDQLPGATTPAQRDQLYWQAAEAAASKGDPRARDFADKISDPEVRRQLRGFVDFQLLNQVLREQKDGAEVMRLAQTGELTSVQRAWGYTEAARLFADTDRARALEALEAAATEARRIDGASPDRARSLVAVATQFMKLDRNRTWELLAEAVKAANAASEFTGADAGLSALVQTRNLFSRITFDTPSLDLSGIFATLATDDMNRALELARSFTGEAPRANATIAAARAILDKHP